MYDVPRLWRQIEKQVNEILVAALAMMRSQIGYLPQEHDELLLNDLLYYYMREAFKQGIHQHLSVNLNPPNTPKIPDPDNPRLVPAIPDLSFRFADLQEVDKGHDRIRFDIECKLLGPPKSKDWKFNKNYFHNGIQRFRDESDRYGEHVPTGAMVGYVRAGQPCEEVHAEINAQCEVHGVSPLRLIQPPGWANAHPIRLEQDLTRQFLAHEFKLFHFWLSIAPATDPRDTLADGPLQPSTLKKLSAKAEQRLQSKTKAAKLEKAAGKLVQQVRREPSSAIQA